MSYMQVVTCLSFLRSQVPKEDFVCGAKFLTKILVSEIIPIPYPIHRNYGIFT